MPRTLQRTLSHSLTFSTFTFEQVEYWVASWYDSEVGFFEVTAPTKAEAARKSLRQQRETEILKQIERCLDFLVAKGCLSEEADTYLTNALFAS